MYMYSQKSLPPAVPFVVSAAPRSCCFTYYTYSSLRLPQYFTVGVVAIATTALRLKASENGCRTDRQ